MMFGNPVSLTQHTAVRPPASRQPGSISVSQKVMVTFTKARTTHNGVTSCLCVTQSSTTLSGLFEAHCMSKIYLGHLLHALIRWMCEEAISSHWLLLSNPNLPHKSKRKEEQSSWRRIFEALRWLIGGSGDTVWNTISGEGNVYWLFLLGTQSDQIRCTEQQQLDSLQWLRVKDQQSNRKSVLYQTTSGSHLPFLTTCHLSEIRRIHERKWDEPHPGQLL